jgi:hypothetical protein
MGKNVCSWSFHLSFKVYSSSPLLVFFFISPLSPSFLFFFLGPSLRGVLYPLERISIVGPALRRMKVALDFSRVVKLPVDEYDRPLVVLVDMKPQLEADQKRLPFIFIQHSNPAKLNRQLQ